MSNKHHTDLVEINIINVEYLYKLVLDYKRWEKGKQTYRGFLEYAGLEDSVLPYDKVFFDAPDLDYRYLDQMIRDLE